MTILIIVLILIAIPLVIALFMSKEYLIQREVVIDKPSSEVFSFIKILKNQERYNKWAMLDPNSIKQYTGTDGTPGFIYAWKSDNKQVGQGEQEIIRVTDGQRIESALRFTQPVKNTADTYMETTPVSANQTKTIWVLKGSRPYIHRLMHLLFNLKKMLGNDMQTSLSTLKTVLENQ